MNAYPMSLLKEQSCSDYVSDYVIQLQNEGMQINL